jgi:queuosine precursor transporter
MSSDSSLPSRQHRYRDLPELGEEELYRRRERVFLVLAGLFLGSLAMLNIIGVTRFLDLSFTLPIVGVTVPMPVAVGVLPYPVTFLCTDFISELYGRRRANEVVLLGFLLNLWVVAILWLGGALPGSESEVFDQVQALAFSAVGASMVAYLAAQLVDVQLFHFWRKLTSGRHLWLRNNGSTVVSQLVDTTAVIMITHYYAGALPLAPDRPVAGQLVTYIAAGYSFKLGVALVDTLPFYLGTARLVRYLRLPPPGRAELAPARSER